MTNNRYAIRSSSLESESTKTKLTLIFILFVFLLLMIAPTPSWAQAQGGGTGLEFPLLTEILCGFYNYSRTRLAPLIAGIVVIFTWLGHLLGSGKAWGAMLGVGIGLSVILGIGSVIVRLTSFGAGCLA